jgi:hypothetical protein
MFIARGDTKNVATVVCWLPVRKGMVLKTLRNWEAGGPRMVFPTGFHPALPQRRVRGFRVAD